MPGLSIEAGNSKSDIGFNKSVVLAPTNKSQGTKQDVSSDKYLAFMGNLVGQIQENLPKLEALGIITKNNPELASVLKKITLMKANGNFNIKDLSKKDAQLIIDNLSLLHSSGMLEAIKKEVNDPAYDAFLKLLNKDPKLASSLASLAFRALTTENFGINNITNDEILLIMNNLDLLKSKDGILNALGERLPKEVKTLIDLSERYPRTYNGIRRLLNTSPSLIDHGRLVYNVQTMPAPVRATVGRGIRIAIGVGITKMHSKFTGNIGISKVFSKLKFW